MPISSSRTGPRRTASTLAKPIDALSQTEMKAYIEEHNIPCPTCGKHDFTDIRQFNLMFKTFQGVTEDAKNDGLPAPGDRPGHLRQLHERAAHHPQKAALRHRPDRQDPSAMRSPPATSPSAPVSSSRWSWSSSASPAPTWSGSTTGAASASNWLLSLGMKEENLRLRDHEPEELCLLLQGHHRLRVSSSPSAGASCGAWPTAPTTT